MRIEHFRQLIVWQLADQLRREIIEFTASGSASKDFRFRDQIRDAIASACRNTSEGFDRFRPAVFANHLEIARASLGEVQDCLIDAHERRYIDGDQKHRMWKLSKRAIGANTKLTAYLRYCAANGLQPWLGSKPGEKPLPDGAAPFPDSANQSSGNEIENPNPEPRTTNREPRTTNREPRTANREPEPRTENPRTENPAS